MKNNLLKILPVLFGFFVMGFCDVVGIATSYVKTDFGLSEMVAGFIPSMVFIWFFLLSVPAAMLMNKIGRKKMVQLSNVITVAGMLIPFADYSFVTCMTGFVFLGIGNTVLQVALNPLLTNVVSGSRLTSMLTTGQVIKAVSSFCGPFIAVFAVKVFGNWQYLFPVFAVITLVSMMWLMFTKLPKEESVSESSSLKSVFALFSDRTVLLLFLGIFFVVGVDVGTNIIAPKLLMERAGYAVAQAGLGSSVYFVCRTVGALIGSVALAKVNEVKYFRANIVVAVAALCVLFFVESAVAIMALVGCVGFFCSSIFSVIYSQALKIRPEKANELSGLMIMGVCGGAVIPPLMGVMADFIGNQSGSMIVVAVCMLYLVGCALWLRKK